MPVSVDRITGLRKRELWGPVEVQIHTGAIFTQALLHTRVILWLPVTGLIALCTCDTATITARCCLFCYYGFYVLSCGCNRRGSARVTGDDSP